MSGYDEKNPEMTAAPEGAAQSSGESGKDGKKSRDPKGTKARRKKRILRRIIVTLLVLAVLGSAGLYTWARLKDEYTVTYDEYTATTGTISNALSFSGALALIDSASYYSSEAATVRTVYVKAGDKVSKGDRLIRLSNGESYTADFDGTVNVSNYEEGDEVSRDTLLVQIADFSRMEVAFRVDEYDISDVSVGDPCVVTATATEKTFESSVDSINYISSSSGNVAYYTAIARVDLEEGSGVYPGMQVTVTIPQEEAVDVVVLKLDALSFSEDNKAFVYLMGGEGKMTENEVEVGVSNGNYVEIKSGLKSGDTVYAEAKTETASTLSSLFSGMFGSQQVNRNSNRQQRNSNNQSGFGSGNMPSGNRNSGGSGSGSGSGSSGGAGGGR